MQLQSEYALLLLLPVLLLMYWVYRNKKKRSSYLVYSHLPPVLKNGGVKQKLAKLPSILNFFILALLVFILARPQSSESKIKRNVEGIDIVVAMDISDSMLIEDMQPVNRLEASKEVIKRFIQGRLSDRIGLVVFSGESYTRVPPTLDYPVLQRSLKEVTTTNNMKMGTAIGVALGNAVSRLQDSKARSRVVILLTDGANNTGTIAPEEALSIAKGYGIKVYTIGMGKEGKAMLPVYRKDVFGNTRKTYQQMTSSVNIELLQSIAEETGGKFYRTNDEKALELVFQQINQLEKTKIDIKQYTKYNEEYQAYLKYLGILLLSSILISNFYLRRTI